MPAHAGDPGLGGLKAQGRKLGPGVHIEQTHRIPRSYRQPAIYRMEDEVTRRDAKI